VGEAHRFRQTVRRHFFVVLTSPSYLLLKRFDGACVKFLSPLLRQADRASSMSQYWCLQHQKTDSQLISQDWLLSKTRASRNGGIHLFLCLFRLPAEDNLSIFPPLYTWQTSLYHCLGASFVDGIYPRVSPVSGQLPFGRLLAEYSPRLPLDEVKLDKHWRGKGEGIAFWQGASVKCLAKLRFSFMRWLRP
jgi:hypothetical protein